LSFLYFVIDRANDGNVEELRDTIEGNELTIGRGGRSQIILRSRLVALEHATIEKQGAGFVVRDLGSSTGVLLNGLPVNEQILKSGDRLQLGDHELRLHIDGEALSLILESDPDGKAAAPTLKLSLRENMPRMVLLAGALMALIFIYFFLFPVTSKDYHSWSSGPISNKHAMFADDCTVCHAMNFTSVSDQQCTQCHTLTEHFLPDKIAGRDMPLLASVHACIDCHREHGGDAHMTITDSRLCINCHGDNSGPLESSDLLAVASVEKHPQFRLSLPSVHSESGELVRVSLDQKDLLHDSATLKLNHAVHLKPGILGADGPVTLGCVDCHTLSSDGRTMQPVSYDAHCASCHTLAFNEKDIEVSIPHADADTVFSTILSAYAKFEIQREFTPEELLEFSRMRPGHRPGERHFAGHPGAAGRILERSRITERELFEKTGCQLCHQIAELSDTEGDSYFLSNYEVSDPGVPEVWMPKARFNHSVHTTVDCLSCHKDVYESTQTSDVLLPGVATCQECHSSFAKRGRVVSECVMCHSFHDSLPVDKETHEAVRSIIFGAR